MEKCLSCTNKTGYDRFKTEILDFVHSGFHFRGMRNSFYCPDCTKKELIKKFDKYCGELVGLTENGELVVNWDEFISKIWDQDETTDILIALGVFSFGSVNTWELTQIGPVGLNPRARGLLYLYFNRGEDAIDYALHKFGSGNGVRVSLRSASSSV